MKLSFFGFFASLAILHPAPAGAEESDSQSGLRAMASHRVELRPYGGWAVVPNSVTGAFVGADLAFRFGRLFALGVDGAWYSPFDESAGVHSSYPLNEMQWSGEVDAYIVPWAATRSGATLGAFEAYLVGGLGALSSRPIPVVDPGVRHFDSNNLVDWCMGAGARLFVSDGIAVTFELRDLMYWEKIENAQVVSGPEVGPGQPGFLDSPLNQATWYSPATRFTNAVQLRLGASFFVP